ncbi:MAG TPA: hypothetical protein VKV17_23575 [Bryobacteraceae bacterium]|nr:hypothetical protein [Bryobacteraceae bacterium]
MKPLRFTNLLSFGLTLALVFSLAACSRKPSAAAKAEKTDDQAAPQMASIIHAGDPQSDTQLVSGFYDVEEHAWRWTSQKFSVVLKPPAGGAERGATLTLQLAVPDPVISKLKSVSLSGTVGPSALAPETYTKAGQYTYTRDIPANLLSAEAVRVDFQLDKALPPGTNGDQRELGVIVSSVGLEAK